MNALDMIKYAKEDNIPYESSFGVYNPDKGFEINEYGEKCFKSDPNKFLTMLLNDETVWHPQPETKKMTLEDIEKELGYKVELINKPVKKVEIKNNNSLEYLLKLLLSEV